MQKDFTVKINRDSLYSEDVLVRSDDGRLGWIYKQNILDEDGNCISWYFHPVYKKLTTLYYDSERQRFWLPRGRLYNRRAVAQLLKRNPNNLAFFKYAYARSIIDGTEPTDLNMSGFLPPGESLW